MAILSNRMRAKLPKSDFGLPQQEERGNLSPSQKAAIFAKANKKLGE